MNTLMTWLNNNPGLAALFLPFVFGAVGHALKGTPLGNLLAALGIDFVKLAALVSQTPPSSGPPAAKPPVIPPGASAALVLLAAGLAWHAQGCTPQARSTIATIANEVRPGCQLVSVVTGSEVAAVVCSDVAAGVADVLHALGSKLGASAKCDAFASVRDAHGYSVGLVCAPLAPAVAAKIGGSVSP